MRGLWLVALAGCGGSSSGDDVFDDAPVVGCDLSTPWAPAAPLAIGPTQETAVVAVADKVYILGGFNNADGIVPAVQIFDTTTCTYSAGPPMPKAVHHINATVQGDTIFVLGALETVNFTAIGDTWSWKVTDADWTVRTSMPAGSQRGAAVAGALADGTLVVAGGFRNGAVTDVSIYDPAGDAWTAGPALPAPRDHACGGVIDGKLYVAGGRMGAITTTAATLFELSGTTWTPRTEMPTARGGTACGVIDRKLIVAGGEGNPNASSGVFPQVESYDVDGDAWQPLADMPTPRHGMGAAATGGRLYVPGGASTQGFGAVATHEVLTP